MEMAYQYLWEGYHWQDLKKRLISEFHPESRNLAKVIFSIQEFRHARTSAH